MLVVFVDSNVFLQCKPLDELPWREVHRSDDDLRILIPRAVQKEIDRLKQDGNSRRAQRARKASGFLRKMLDASNEELLLKTKELELRIGLAPTLKACDGDGRLDLSRADDCVVGEALAYKSEAPDFTVMVLSDDTGMLTTAKHCGLSYFPVPDSWLLPPELDPRDKQITQLQLELNRLRQSMPEIRVEAIPSEVERVVKIKRFRELSGEEIEEHLKDISILFPMKVMFRGSSSGYSNFDLLTGFRPPSAAEIKRYHESEYPQWLEAVKRFFERLSSELERPTRCLDLSFHVTNLGSAPADHLVVEIKALGGLLLMPPEKEVERPCLPKPPKPPARRLASTFDHLLDSRFIHDPFWARGLGGSVDKDRYSFYWKPGRPSEPVGEWRLECEEFRHQGDPEEFDVRVLVPDDVKESRGAISFAVTAGNLPDRVELFARISISEEEGSIEEEIANLFDGLRGKSKL